MRYAEFIISLSIVKGEIKQVRRKRNVSPVFCFLNLKFEFRKAMYFTYLEALGSGIQWNSKEIYCRSDITD